MTDAVSDAIAKAREAAANVVDDAEVLSEQLPATTEGAGAVVNFSKPSMEKLANNVRVSNLVDEWLKVSEHGISVGANIKPTFDKIKAKINLTEGEGFFVKEMIKWGNPVKYASRYDGHLTDRGEPWAEVVARAQRMDERAKVYPSADLIFHLREPLKLKDKTLEPGTRLGHTLAMTNWENWADFYRVANKAGLVDQVVDVIIGYDEVNGKNGYTWGVLNFSLDNG